MLMFQENQAVLGQAAERFGFFFPVRFNFLDTIKGGELAIQSHPREEYIRKHFGEAIAQDESYYILDCQPGSRVWLGFQETVDSEDFRQALETSRQEQVPVEIEQYVQVLPTKRHDYFLIPSATVHAAGFNNLVLEISSTPYIFTFKLYDWLAKDLNGELRPLHLEHGFHNLDFQRRGEQARQELISQPEVVAQGPGWQVERLPTHAEHFYAVFRFEFSTTLEWETRDSFNVLNLVEGQSIRLETKFEGGQRYHWAETFIIPAAAKKYRLINEGSQPAKVVMACMKPGV
jgi:mannose-6-phosphate isomerase class I